jgi:hypothetical protein
MTDTRTPEEIRTELLDVVTEMALYAVSNTQPNRIRQVVELRAELRRALKREETHDAR